MKFYIEVVSKKFGVKTKALSYSSNNVGRVVFASCYPNDSWFDIYSTGVVGSNRHLAEINEYGECRVSFQSLCEIIESYGGIVMNPVSTPKYQYTMAA